MFQFELYGWMFQASASIEEARRSNLIGHECQAIT